MYIDNRLYMKPTSKLADIIYNNPSLLYVLEYFNIDYMLQDKNVEEFCTEHNINIDLFVAISNIYNGFSTDVTNNFTIDCIPFIINFLHNTHAYYQQEKYPEIRSLIDELYKVNPSAEIGIVEKFFDEYYDEVNEHLGYEDKVVFPYVKALYKKITTPSDNETEVNFSAKQYRQHHTDIEFKLDELKKILIKYIPVKQDKIIRRQLLLALCEVETNLNAHSIIEEHILMPLVDKIERQLQKQ